MAVLTLTGLAGLLVGAVVSWQLVRAQMAAWVAGCCQGRDDVLSLARTLGVQQPARRIDYPDNP